MMKRLLVTTAIALVGVLGIAGVALAADSSGRAAKREGIRECVAAKAPQSPADRRDAVRECAKEQGVGGERPKRRAVFGHAAHGELVVPKRGAESQWETVVFDRGEVTGIDDASISLKRPDGPTVTLGLSPETRFPDGRPEVGTQARVVSVGGSARLVTTLSD